MKHNFQVAIIGGGIGGAALARSLDRLGIDYHMFERASVLSEVGAGVQMTPNAVKVLEAIGLGPDLAAAGFLPEAMVGWNWQSGEELFRTPLREVCPRVFGAEFYHVHRADLHTMLAKDITPERITFGVSCTGLRQQAGRTIACFDDGSEYAADLVVGADGVRSAVRAVLWGQEPASYTGHMCWRALVPVEQFPLPFVTPTSAFWMGPKGHVVTYYVKGGAMVNIVAVNENHDWVEESWTIKSSRQELLDGFAGWNDNLIRLFELTNPDQIYKWGLFDRDPMPRWSRGNATLLGDAAHPMLPFLSQGAAMAVEDGYVLAQALSHFGPGDLGAALDAYEAERRPRTTRVQLEARERGRTYHLSSPEESKARDLAFKLEQAKNPNAVGIKAEWVYQYDARTCRDRFGKSPALSAAS
ncbi:salicylate hydroxylase [Tardiphaga sp. OK246]|jgi:salicylate hydroxylase|uniref:FAD-dependent monooxygenase n=1 Tax=Tardiphaga sp. OK246 TaxID=1855307 RepID=UPI000B73D902|nr:FAD-dependent monooxygenase [Tardiphaga sp. OK246]SNT55088.1 salicylate hydroxylase [Tardiphaga sp. OK246]